MLQERLDKNDIIIIVLVNLRGIVFPEAMGADILVAQPVAGHLKNALYRPDADRENSLMASDLVFETVVFYVLVNQIRAGEIPDFSGFLFPYIKTVPISVPDETTEFQLKDVSYPQS